MVLGVVASDGKKMPPFFFKSREKVGVNVYYKVLRYHVLPWLKAKTRERNYLWAQDGTPWHTANKVQKFCKVNFADFWQRNLDLNPLDYALWGVLEQARNKTSHSNISSLKATIEEEWAKMPKDFVVKSCASF